MSTIKATNIQHPSAGSPSLVLSSDGGMVASGLTGAGLDLITSETFSAVSSVSVNGCFDASYQNYRLIWNVTPSTAGDVDFRLRASGTDNTSSQYLNARLYVGQAISQTFTSTNNSTQNRALTSYAANQGNAALDIFQPFATARTQACFISAGGLFMVGGFQMTVTTSYDGFSIIASAGTISGDVYVYGYKD